MVEGDVKPAVLADAHYGRARMRGVVEASSRARDTDVVVGRRGQSPGRLEPGRGLGRGRRGCHCQDLLGAGPVARKEMECQRRASDVGSTLGILGAVR